MSEIEKLEEIKEIKEIESDLSNSEIKFNGKM